MTPGESALASLQHRVSSALRRTQSLEEAYRAITVGQLVSLRARTHGSMAAIDIFERGERATYSEMDRTSNQYARALREFGVRKGDRVGVMLPNRIEFPLLWFALAKLGAVLVPLNMRYTGRELGSALRDTAAKFAIVDESVSARFFAIDPWPAELAKNRVVVVDQPLAAEGVCFESLLAGVDDLPVHEEVHAEDLLNIQYTSGTTGFPKGCMLTHEYWSVTSRVFAHYDEEPYQRNLSWVPFFYVYGQMELIKSYWQGGTLYLAQRLSASRFLDWIKTLRIEYCTLPELVALQLEAGDEAAMYLRQVEQGAGWSLAAMRHFHERCDAFAHDPFAMTEIGWGTQMPREVEEMTHAVGSMGIRAPFRELRLVTESGDDAAVGEVGELWVRGRGIFSGYWNRPEANAELFDGEWFKTGDQVYRDELGFYFFVGRSKDMIRRSGENISAHEVEAMLREMPEIADLAAVPVPDPKRGEEVKVVVELQEGLTPDSDLVRRLLEHAASRLAVFKIPRYVAFVETLPRTASSEKVLKRELINVTDPLAGVFDAEEQRWR